MVLREVLQLYQAAGPSTGAVGSIELEHAVSPAVHADGVLHGLIFLHGRFRELLAEHERIQDILAVGGIDQFLHSLLI